MEFEHEGKTGTAESNKRADPHPRKVIFYKEYAACKAVEGKPSMASKPALEGEENWDEEPSLLPHETPPGAKPMVPSQEDEWKSVVDQDPHSGSVAGDSKHETMAVTQEDEPIDSTEELVAVHGVDEDVTIEHLSNVEWKEDDPLSSMMRMSPNHKHQLLLQPWVRHWQKTKLFHHLNHPLERRFASESRSENIYQRQLLQHTWNLFTRMQS